MAMTEYLDIIHLTQESDPGVKAGKDIRTCTCHPDDRPINCPRRFATSECIAAELKRETLFWLEVLANTPGVGNDMNAWQQLSSRVLILCEGASALLPQDGKVE